LSFEASSRVFFLLLLAVAVGNLILLVVVDSSAEADLQPWWLEEGVAREEEEDEGNVDHYEEDGRGVGCCEVGMSVTVPRWGPNISLGGPRRDTNPASTCWSTD
jgi:hypothetical protein